MITKDLYTQLTNLSEAFGEDVTTLNECHNSEVLELLAKLHNRACVVCDITTRLTDSINLEIGRMVK